MIKNLMRQLNEAGKIKIGKKGKMITSKNGNEFRPPQKIDHFQLVTTEKNAEGDYIRDTSLESMIKESGSGIVNKAGNLVGLPIRLVYNDVESIFPNRYVSYVSGKLSCHGDGEVSKKRLDNFVKDNSCPCNRIDSNYDGKDKCKPTGTLSCVIDAAGLFGQAHTFRTTSMNTIRGILGGIEMISEATYGKIAWLPLMLTINEKNTVTPGGIPTKVFIVSVCFRGSVDQLRERVLKQLATDKQYLLDTKTAAINPVPGVDTEDEKDFVNEFFPENIIDVNTQVVKDEPGETVSDNNIETSTTDQDDKQDGNPTGEPTGDYKGLYDRLIDEPDINKAFALVKRLKLANIKYWLKKDHPFIDFEDNVKKNEILDVAKVALKRYYLKEDEGKNQETNQAETKSQEANNNENIEHCPECSKEMCETDTGFICTACQTQLTEKDKINNDDSDKNKIEYIGAWDDSKNITPIQCRQLVDLKFDLEKAGVLRPDQWVQHVNYFTNKEGDRIEKATKLTTVQGDTFIAMLEHNLPK